MYTYMPGYIDIIDPVHVDGFTPSKVFMQVFFVLMKVFVSKFDYQEKLD